MKSYEEIRYAHIVNKHLRKFLIFISDNVFRRFALGSSFSIGRRNDNSKFFIVVYGRDAMHYAIQIFHYRVGWICFRLPLRCFGKWWPLYFYISKDATPFTASFKLGRCNY